MADDALVLNDCLCFVVNKYSKIAAKMLKFVLLDFYSAEDLCSAKLQLCNDIDKLDLTLKRPHVAQRRDTDIQARINKEVDDVFLLITFVDENKLLDKLPRYVAISPDRMPSLRLYDGDMNVLLNLLHAMDNRLSSFEAGLSAITRDVHSFFRAGGLYDWPHLLAQSTAGSVAAVACDVNKTSTTQLAATVGKPIAGASYGNSTSASQTNAVSETESTRPTSSAVLDWATLASTPLQLRNKYAPLPSTDDEECHDHRSEEPFETVTSPASKRTR